MKISEQAAESLKADREGEKFRLAKTVLSRTSALEKGLEDCAHIIRLLDTSLLEEAKASANISFGINSNHEF